MELMEEIMPPLMPGDTLAELTLVVSRVSSLAAFALISFVHAYAKQKDLVFCRLVFC